MNTDNNLSEKVLGAVFEVSNTLGAGFLEKVYERALLKELGIRGLRAASQVSFPVATRAIPSANTLPTSSSRTLS